MNTKKKGLTSFLSTLHGAGSRGRTDTVSLPLDFESSTSANSITPALKLMLNYYSIISNKSQAFETKKLLVKFMHIYIKNSLLLNVNYDKINIQNQLFFLYKNNFPGGFIMCINDLKILICDDSMFARKKLGMFISSLGITTIYEAADGKESVEKYMKFKPDVVFMDIVMPVLTGVDALKQIMAFDPEAKVIMASSVGTQSHLKEAINAGAIDFLQKPIDDSQVEKILNNISRGN